jgi:hypothetical protein
VEAIENYIKRHDPKFLEDDMMPSNSETIHLHAQKYREVVELYEKYRTKVRKDGKCIDAITIFPSQIYAIVAGDLPTYCDKCGHRLP